MHGLTAVSMTTKACVSMVIIPRIRHLVPVIGLVKPCFSICRFRNQRTRPYGGLLKKKALTSAWKQAQMSIRVKQFFNQLINHIILCQPF